MDTVFFGLSPNEYDDSGLFPRIALNHDNIFVAVHQGPTGGLWYWYGAVDGVVMNFYTHGEISNGTIANNGTRPSVAVRGTTVIEMHDGGANNDLYYWIGEIRPSNYRIEWITNRKYDDGAVPSVAVNDRGIVVEVHPSDETIFNNLWWSTFRLNGTGPLTPLKKGEITTDHAFDLSVAVNNNDIVVVVQSSNPATNLSSDLWYWIGRLKSDDTIDWIGHEKYDSGSAPSVTLDDNNNVYEIHQSPGGGGLWQRVGKVIIDNSIGRITWEDYFGQIVQSYQFDSGAMPAIGGNGKTAVQVHQNDMLVTASLWGNAALIFDRGNWMGQNLATLGPRPLNTIAMPASHDAGMYLGGFELHTVAKNQDLNLRGQLLDGTRYFDLRPLLDEDDDYLYIHHNSIKGPKLDACLGEVKGFLRAGSETPRELIILKFSHYENFGEPVDASNPVFVRMINKITEILGPWLYDVAVPLGERLASYPLSHFIEDGGRVLVVCDQVPSQCLPGVYSYRDWYSIDPQNGDLTVFDCYSDTGNLDTMMTSTEPNTAVPSDIPGFPRGQIPKFQGPGVDGTTNLYNGFTGQCYYNAGIPCDLFLLSWTLTSPVGTFIWDFAKDADAALVDNIPSNSGNRSGQINNLIFVDFVEYARSVDLAYLRNGLGPQTTAAKRVSSELLEQSS